MIVDKFHRSSQQPTRCSQNWSESARYDAFASPTRLRKNCSPEGKPPVLQHDVTWLNHFQRRYWDNRTLLFCGAHDSSSGRQPMSVEQETNGRMPISAGLLSRFQPFCRQEMMGCISTSAGKHFDWPVYQTDSCMTIKSAFARFAVPWSVTQTWSQLVSTVTDTHS